MVQHQRAVESHSANPNPICCFGAFASQSLYVARARDQCSRGPQSSSCDGRSLMSCDRCSFSRSVVYKSMGGDSQYTRCPNSHSRIKQGRPGGLACCCPRCCCCPCCCGWWRLRGPAAFCNVVGALTLSSHSLRSSILTSSSRCHSALRMARLEHTVAAGSVGCHCCCCSIAPPGPSKVNLIAVL